MHTQMNRQRRLSDRSLKLAGLAFLCAVAASAQTLTIPDAPVDIVLRSSPLYTNVFMQRDGDLSKSLTVELQSSNTNVFEVPVSTSFDVGEDTAAVFIRANALGSGYLLMSATGYVTEPTLINVVPPLSLAVSPSPLNIFTNFSLTGTAAVVRLGAVPGDLNTNTTVSIMSTDSNVFTVPSMTVFAPTMALAQTNFVTVTAVTPGSASMVLTAGGIPAVSNTVNVYPSSIYDLSIIPDPIAVVLDNTAVVTARVVRVGSVPGDLDNSVTIDLTSGDPGVFTVGAQTVFAPTMALAQTNEIVITGIAPGVNVLTAVATGAPEYPVASAVVQVAQSAILEIRIQPDPIGVNLQQSSVFNVTLVRQGAVAGDLDEPLSVALSSADHAVFTVTPTNVVFPATSDTLQTVGLLITGHAVGNSTLHAVPQNVAYDAVSVDVSVFRPTLSLPANIYLFTNVITQAGVTRSGGDLAVPLTVTLTQPAGPPQYFEMRGAGPGFQSGITLNIPPGAPSASFELRGLEMTPAPVQLTASAPGYQSAQALVWVVTDADTDGDGIPDWWEIFYFGSPTGADAEADPDGDGINNYWEYRLGGDPFDAYSLDPAGVMTDGEWDSDGDGLSNWEEIHIWGTDPTNPDTDDNGFSDGDEVDPNVICGGRRVTHPADSRSPLIPKSIRLDGTPRTVPTLETVDRFALNDSWTVEAWVRLDSVGQSGWIVRRRLNNGRVNFALGLENGRPLIEFTTVTDRRFFAGGPSADVIPADTWTYVAGVFDSTNKTLNLYVNGIQYQSQIVLQMPAAAGGGETAIGSGLLGYMDELRIWSVARPSDEIAEWYDKTLRFEIEEVEEIEEIPPTISVNPNLTAQQLWEQMLGAPVPSGVSNIGASLTGNDLASGSFVGFPILPQEMPRPNRGVILSSGSVLDAAATSNTESGKTSNWQLPGDPHITAMVGQTSYDASAMTITFTTDATVEGLSFNVLFASEEFPIFVGSFNDAFGAFLNGENITFDDNGDPLTVNNNFFELNNQSFYPDHEATIGKLHVDLPFEYNGLTKLLTTNKKLDPGTHTLKFVIADVGDGILDSVVFLSNFKFELTGEEGTDIAPPSSGVDATPSDLVAYYTFDDGQNESVVNPLDGQIHAFGAEDHTRPLDWRFAIQDVTFSSDEFANLQEFFSDLSGNGIPDWWELVYFGETDIDPLDDPDRDGLNNLYEYLADTNPLHPDTDNDGIPDGAHDLDGDGLSNAQEQRKGTHPLLPDTADNGILDGSVSDPLPGESLTPLVDRVLQLNGASGSYVQMPNQARFSLPAWTIQAWANPTAAGGRIVARQVRATTVNYALEINGVGRPGVRFSPGDGTADIVLTSPSALTLGVWAHLAATFNDDSGRLSLFVNGSQVATMLTNKRPAVTGVGPLWTRAGAGFAGMLDEVAIFDRALSAAEIAVAKNGVAMQTNLNDSLVSFYRFDDGTSAAGPAANGRHYGTSGNPAWWWGQVEEFAPGFEHDWLNEWRNAGTLVGQVAMLAVVNPPVNYVGQDTNEDGIPDWWYIAHGFDPAGPSIAWEDPDGDGLHNLAEFLAGTDPLVYDTYSSGLGDFYYYSGVGPDRYRIYGELYTDYDGMNDAWEIAYGLDPNRFDAHEDADGDGWSNLSEFMAGKLPNDHYNYPRPALIMDVSYNGSQRYGSLVVDVYSNPSMDGDPDARFVTAIQPNMVITDEYMTTLFLDNLNYSGKLSFAPIEPGSLTFNINREPGIVLAEVFSGVQDAVTGAWTDKLQAPYGSTGTINYRTGEWTISLNPDVVAEHGGGFDRQPLRADYTANLLDHPFPVRISRDLPQSGHIREGQAWFFVFNDLDGNGTWDEGEPAGIAYNQPFDISWNRAGPIVVGLKDSELAWPRFAWEPASGVVDHYRVSIRNMGATGAPEIFRRTIRAPRHYVHTQDYFLAGHQYGLPHSGYEWYVYAVNGSTETLLDSGGFLATYPSTVAAPTPVSPSGIMRYARNDFVWNMDPAATAFRLQISANANFNPVLVDHTAVTPPRDSNGRVSFDLPQLAGDGVLTEGAYYWRVRAGNPLTVSAYSTATSMNIDLSDRADAPFSIAGDVMYPGKVTNSVFVVQAFRSPCFSGRPDAQVVVPNMASTATWPQHLMPYRLRGLRSGTYYLRAFLDQNNNRRPDIWETQGFVRHPNSYYFPKAITVPVSRSGQIVTTMFRDTDNDRIADDWEYMYYGNLSTAGPGPLRGYTQTAIPNINHYEAYAHTPMNINPTDPNAAGADGIPLRIKADLGLDYLEMFMPSLADIGRGEAGRPVLTWVEIEGGEGAFVAGTNGSVRYAASGGGLVYSVQFSSNLRDWVNISGAVMVTASGDEVSFVPDQAPAPGGFYRLVVRW